MKSKVNELYSRKQKTIAIVAIMFVVIVVLSIPFFISDQLDRQTNKELLRIEDERKIEYEECQKVFEEGQCAFLRAAYD